MAAPDLLLLNWNVHGLNAPIKCHAVKDMVAAVKATLIYLQLRPRLKNCWAQASILTSPSWRQLELVEEYS
jgi:hypothetical protein